MNVQSPEITSVKVLVGITEATGFFHRYESVDHNRNLLNWAAKGLNILGYIPGVNKVSGAARIALFGTLLHFRYNSGREIDVEVQTYYTMHIIRGVTEIAGGDDFVREFAILDVISTLARQSGIIRSNMQLP